MTRPWPFFLNWNYVRLPHWVMWLRGQAIRTRKVREASLQTGKNPRLEVRRTRLETQSSLSLCDLKQEAPSYQAPLSVGFSTQQYWSGLPFPSPEDLPNPGIEPGSPALQADSLVSEPQGRSLGSFWGDGNVWYLDSDDGVTDTYFCQNSSWTLFNGYS